MGGSHTHARSGPLPRRGGDIADPADTDPAGGSGGSRPDGPVTSAGAPAVVRWTIGGAGRGDRGGDRCGDGCVVAAGPIAEGDHDRHDVSGWVDRAGADRFDPSVSVSGDVG